MNRLTLAVCALATMSVVACDAEPLPDSDSEISFRSGPGDGDLSIHVGDDTSVPGSRVWELVNNQVYSESASTGALMLEVIGDEIYDASGALRCSRIPVGDEGSNLIEELRDGTTGDVYYTVMGKWVFYGRQDLPNPDFSQLAFTFKADQVFEGSHVDDIVLVTATERIEWAGDMRKLLIASLIDGHCGAPGL